MMFLIDNIYNRQNSESDIEISVVAFVEGEYKKYKMIKSTDDCQ